MRLGRASRDSLDEESQRAILLLRVDLPDDEGAGQGEPAVAAGVAPEPRLLLAIRP